MTLLFTSYFINCSVDTEVTNEAYKGKVENKTNTKLANYILVKMIMLLYQIYSKLKTTSQAMRQMNDVICSLHITNISTS